MSTTPPPLPLPPVTIQPPPSPAKSGIPLILIIVGVVGVVVVGIAILAGLTAPVLLRMRKKGDQVVAISNGKSLAMAMSDFSAEYGGLPDQETAKVVTAKGGSSLNLSGDTANDYFRQLIASGAVTSEDPFWAKTSNSPRRPDNNMAGTEALKAGEVGFGYVMNGTRGFHADDGEQIIAVTPLANQSGGFDTRPFDGKAVYVFSDGRVEVRVIGPDGNIKLGSGKTIPSISAETVRDTAVIKAPKKK